MRKVRSEAAADRIRYGREHDGNCPRLAGKGTDHGRGHTEDRIGPQAAACDQFRCASQLVITILSIRGSAGGLYYSLDGGQCGSIQMRIIYDLTLHSLTFGFQVLLEVLERRR